MRGHAIGERATDDDELKGRKWSILGGWRLWWHGIPRRRVVANVHVPWRAVRFLLIMTGASLLSPRETLTPHSPHQKVTIDGA